MKEIKNLIKQTSYNKDTDIFDWLNSFEFNKMISSIDNNFNIFENIQDSPFDCDIQSTNILYNNDYVFRMPHENDIQHSINKYKRRFEKFINYKNDSDGLYLFIRIINTGFSNCPAESLENNYNEENYNRLMTYLPINSKILLITHRKLLADDKNKIFYKFYVVDNIISPDFIAYGPYLQNKKDIIDYYQTCFDYISNNFNNFDINAVYSYIKNENIGILN